MSKENQAYITEIFSSIQGEGPYVGVRQIFIRFTGCNLNCKYCDTDFSSNNIFSKEQLLQEVDFLMKTPVHSISLTGGEPLLSVDFLSEFLPEVKNKFPQVKIYLETNGTLFQELEKIIENIDIISMDLKIKSSTGADFPADSHKKFIEISQKYNKEIFAKVVISSKITDEEIKEVSDFLSSFKETIPLILQPITSEDKDLLVFSTNLLEIQEKFLKKLQNVRVIPQTHKFLDLL